MEVFNERSLQVHPLNVCVKRMFYGYWCIDLNVDVTVHERYVNEILARPLVLS